MNSTPQNSIDYARALYRLDLAERIERERESTPPPFVGLMFLTALLVVLLSVLAGAVLTSDDAPPPAAQADTQALQTAIDTHCTTGSTEQRLACAIDVAQGQGHGMAPDEYARAKRAASMLNRVPGQASQPLAVGAPVAGADGRVAPIVVEVDALPVNSSIAVQRGNLLISQSALEPDLAGERVVVHPIGHRQANRLVAPVGHNVTATPLQLQAVGQKHVSE